MVAMALRIETDGTRMGTFVYEDGVLLRNVVSVQRQGRNTYVERRYRDVEWEGVEGDFQLSIKPSRA